MDPEWMTQFITKSGNSAQKTMHKAPIQDMQKYNFLVTKRYTLSWDIITAV
jgi:hypothetical protein